MLAGNIDNLTVYFCPVLKKRDAKARQRRDRNVTVLLTRAVSVRDINNRTCPVCLIA